VVEDGENAMISELQLEPRCPVVSVHCQFLSCAFIKFDRIISVALGKFVLDLGKVGEHHGIHRVMSPGLL
jgi:hypothetical protein